MGFYSVNTKCGRTELEKAARARMKARDLSPLPSSAPKEIGALQLTFSKEATFTIDSSFNVKIDASIRLDIEEGSISFSRVNQ